jgi:predicted RNase H-like nuclease (RuvC/YqgF family)
MYSYESLEVLTKKRLLDLSEYLEVPNVYKSMRKGEVIEAILEYMKPEVVEEDVPPMSVRVKRIYESQERK